MAPRFFPLPPCNTFVNLVDLLGSLKACICGAYCGIHQSVCFCILVKYRLSAPSLASHSRVVQSIRFVSKIISLLVCSISPFSCMVHKRTLSSLGSHLIPTHHSPPSGLLSIGSLPSTFFIAYSAPIPPFFLPIPYNLRYTT